MIMQPTNHEHFLGKNRTPAQPVTSTDKNYIGAHHPEQEGQPIFSSQTTRMDYVTLEGIENRTGIEKENAYAFVIKELLDNAVDFLETEHIGISRKKDQKDMETIHAAEDQVHKIKEVVAESKSEKQEESNFTRIEIRLPLIQHLLDIDKLKKFLTGYVTFNTHIDFIFKIPSGSSSDQTNKDDDNITLSFPQVQPI